METGNWTQTECNLVGVLLNDVAEGSDNGDGRLSEWTSLGHVDSHCVATLPRHRRLGRPQCVWTDKDTVASPCTPPPILVVDFCTGCEVIISDWNAEKHSVINVCHQKGQRCRKNKSALVSHWFTGHVRKSL